MMDLRPYQIQAKDAVLEEWNQGRKKTLLVLPTGTGKTVIFSAIIEEQVKKGGRALVLAHRGELLEQAADKLMKVCSIPSALEKAECSSLNSLAPVTVGSIQTLSQDKRLDAFPEDYFSDIVVDEAHHCLSQSYLKVLNHFKSANVLGVTATPDRGDHKNLGTFFDSKAYEYPMAKAIREGYLCPIKAQMIPLKLDIGSVSISSGDYAAGEIGCALGPYLNQIAEYMAKYCQGRKTVVFLPLVSTSQTFCYLLQKYGMNAVEVNGNTPNRTEILNDFENGKYDVLCNSMLLTEGWDCPSVDCVVVLRPTKLRGLYQQMVGRGMRNAPDKDYLLLLDFLWMTERHDLCRPSSLISKDEEISKKIDMKLSEDDEIHDLIDAEAQAQRDVIAERESSLALTLSAMRKRKAKLVDPLQYALSIAAEDLANYEPTFSWEMGPPTEGQLKFLEKRGILPESVENTGKARLIIEKLINRQHAGLSTPKQIRLLERYGFYHVGEWLFDDASNMISRIASNNWFVPRGIKPAEFRP